MKKIYQSIIIICVSTWSIACFSAQPHAGYLVVQVGQFSIKQGDTQFIGIDGMIGNQYVVTQNRANSGFLGLGYYLNGKAYSWGNFSYGIDAFYFPTTSVSGYVNQELLYPNLTYHYSMTYLPVYAAIKSTFNTQNPKFSFTTDLGVGPSIVRAENYREQSNDGGITIPDNAFHGHTTTAISAMIGVGIRINKAFGQSPVECGYRFFYLGQSHFENTNSEILNNMHTSNASANAVMCSVSF